MIKAPRMRPRPKGIPEAQIREAVRRLSLPPEWLKLHKFLPLLFTGEMVREILAGRKRQTRRPIVRQPSQEWSPFVGIYNPTCISKTGEAFPGDAIFGAADEDEGRESPCRPGDVIWVRETIAEAGWWIAPGHPNGDAHEDAAWSGTGQNHYFADGPVPVPPDGCVWRTKPSILMPFGAARLFLPVERVRVERVGEISEADARAEGFHSKADFLTAWGNMYGARHGLDDWCWAFDFEFRTLQH